MLRSRTCIALSMSAYDSVAHPPPPLSPVSCFRGTFFSKEVVRPSRGRRAAQSLKPSLFQATHLLMCRVSPVRCCEGIKGFWWSYPNIYDLVERELKIEKPFTDWTRSSFFSPDGLQARETRRCFVDYAFSGATYLR